MSRTPPYGQPDIQPKETLTMSKTVRYKLHVVSHTHWDREWYSPFQQYRQRLVRLVDGLLDLMERNPDYRYFVFDGQAIIFEDYFEIRPENRDRFKALVQSGRIEIGPWYVLPDEFLVSAESLVRNLQIGHRIANEHGGVMKVGYAPDSFGHVAQMPQILRGCNIDSFIFTRGLGDEDERLGTEFLWIAPDGNRVLAIYQRNGYCNGADLGFECLGDYAGEAPRLDTLLDRLHQQMAQLGTSAKTASDGTRHLLINNGCDHKEPQSDLPRLLNFANSVLKDCTAEQTTFSRFIQAVRRSGLSLSNFTGEMHSSKHHFILSGVLSSRVYLKQQNDACETLLAHIAEPLSALAWLRTGVNHCSPLLSHAWRALLKNHPHDSICGCSIDLVHRDMQARFDEARQIGENVADATLDALAQRVRRPSTQADWPAFVVANSLACSRSEMMRCLVLFPPKRFPKTLAVVDSNNQPLPTHLINYWPLSSRKGYTLPEAFDRLGQTSGKCPLTHGSKRAQLFEDRANFNLTPEKGEAPWQVAEVEFLTPEMAPMSYRTFSVRSIAPAAAMHPVRVKGFLVENAYLRAKFYPDGSLDLFDKASQRQFKRCHIFEDVEDVGDEYDYSPARRSQVFWSRGKKGKLRLVHQSPLAAEIEVSLTWPLPEKFDRDRSRRSAKMVRCPLHVRFTITAAAPYIAVHTTFQNLARDHRLRVHCATPIKTTASLAGQQFYVIERPLKKASGKNWLQAPGATDPMQHFCAVEDRKGGVAFLTQGLFEYEVRKEANGTTLILTLMRAVGWLSRNDLATRPGNAGPSFPVPEAQCPGKQEFHYAVMPYAGNWEKANLPLLAQRYRVPLVEKSCHGAGGTLSADFSLFRLEPNSLIVTAIKKCDHRDTLIIRLYNASSQRVKGRIFSGLLLARAWKVNLLEDRLEEVTVYSNSRVDLDFPAWRIITLELEMSKSVLGISP
jgi:alpha-mannosidase